MGAFKQSKGLGVSGLSYKFCAKKMSNACDQIQAFQHTATNVLFESTSPLTLHNHYHHNKSVASIKYGLPLGLQVIVRLFNEI